MKLWKKKEEKKTQILKDLNTKGKLEYLIEGYRGYDILKYRDISDKSFRKHILYQNQSVTDVLKEAHKLLIQTQAIAAWPSIQFVLQQTAITAKTLEMPDYGFTTFFETKDIEKAKIEEIQEMESELVDHYETLDKYCITVHNQLSEFEIGGISTDISKIRQQIALGSKIIENRNTIIRETTNR